MIAYKGFNEDLTCTMGKGTFQYKVGETYEEDKAQCAGTGFHCVEEPIEVLSWYSRRDSRYCIVIADGDVHEDGKDRISCTKMTVLREVTLMELGMLECEWIIQHPERTPSRKVKRNEGEAEPGGIVIVKGKNPKAKGKEGSVLFLLQEEGGKVVRAAVYAVSKVGGDIKPDQWCGVDGCIKTS